MILLAAALGAAVSAVVPGASAAVRSWLVLSLPQRPSGHGEVFLVLAAHNFVVCAWPLALRALALDRFCRLRIAFSIPVVFALIANGAVVGVACGAYGPRLLSFLPHLPLEWAALAAGSAGWFAAGAARPRLWVALAALVATAAAIETWVAPL